MVEWPEGGERERVVEWCEGGKRKEEEGLMVVLLREKLRGVFYGSQTASSCL